MKKNSTTAGVHFTGGKTGINFFTGLRKTHPSIKNKSSFNIKSGRDIVMIIFS
ncbi:hypothetical protein SeD_B0054 (plasmid) [Salmonella enterica subsp. enterica serovar Dublin str. CT_02021853]|uniref:Uncharacterized protein n=2 Tax=Salmonella dublin TaxID=98360 RepID=A0A8X6JWX7_SALDU|nr:hypothetical protein [Salmonella enterica]ACH73494.1 hypothetical protein SeD_B0054 [Salmonella enterica subsp. enterica serovar Dublin str. CT_02021853]EGE27983.1 hypothetical protein SD3246_p043 [Salmonella enterica subsp. enterica serovar Dublin str. SD3246]EGE32674.1 hypothetical protein SG9_p54 [Salmonella enterica subsp. enterica serovar Gallinarum str. SG9]